MDAIRDCSQVTFENALLGDAMIQKLQAKGSALEQEKSGLAEELMAEAQKLRMEREEKEEVRQRRKGKTPAAVCWMCVHCVWMYVWMCVQSCPFRGGLEACVLCYNTSF